MKCRKIHSASYRAGNRPPIRGSEGVDRENKQLSLSGAKANKEWSYIIIPHTISMYYV
jgi:hypothetical protein